jgi:hypothetical protein
MLRITPAIEMRNGRFMAVSKLEVLHLDSPNRNETNMIDNRILGELKFEVDSFYVAAEMILAGIRVEPPLDGLLFEACLLHFRLVWDFFYGPWKKNDARPRDFITGGIPKKERPKQTAQLKAIRRSLDETVAHLSRRRVTPGFKAGQVSWEDLPVMQQHIAKLFAVFAAKLTQDQRDALVNPLAPKFAKYKTLNP